MGESSFNIYLQKNALLKNGTNNRIRLGLAKKHLIIN